MNNLHQSLTQLEEILKKVGVEELMVSDDAHHHIISNDGGAAPEVIELFCSRIQQLYSEITEKK